MRDDNKKKYTHLMVDIETLGLQTDSVILSIGAVCFNIEDGTLGEEFEMYPIVETQNNRNMEWSSLKFWLNQPDSVRKQQSESIRTSHLLNCFYSFSEFCSENLTTDFKVWGNGFDIPLLNQAYSQYNIKTPWSYKGIFDCRTIVWLANISTSEYNNASEQKHNSIIDCHYQIRFVVDAYHVLNYK
jgi:hypothetical protein